MGELGIKGSNISLLYYLQGLERNKFIAGLFAIVRHFNGLADWHAQRLIHELPWIDKVHTTRIMQTLGMETSLFKSSHVMKISFVNP